MNEKQLSLFDWHNVEDELPQSSGRYLVEDRKGRQFKTWFEETIMGFDSMPRDEDLDHVGFKIIAWKRLGA